MRFCLHRKLEFISSCNFACDLQILYRCRTCGKLKRIVLNYLGHVSDELNKRMQRSEESDINRSIKEILAKP